MTRSDTLWDLFQKTGYIGAYLLYRYTDDNGQQINQTEGLENRLDTGELAGILHV